MLIKQYIFAPDECRPTVMEEVRQQQLIEIVAEEIECETGCLHWAADHMSEVAQYAE